MTLLNRAFAALVAAGTCMLYILEWKITADIVFFLLWQCFPVSSHRIQYQRSTRSLNPESVSTHGTYQGVPALAD